MKYLYIDITYFNNIKGYDKHAATRDLVSFTNITTNLH